MVSVSPGLGGGTISLQSRWVLGTSHSVFSIDKCRFLLLFSLITAFIFIILCTFCGCIVFVSSFLGCTWSYSSSITFLSLFLWFPFSHLSFLSVWSLLSRVLLSASVGPFVCSFSHIFHFFIILYYVLGWS